MGPVGKVGFRESHDAGLQSPKLSTNAVIVSNPSCIWEFPKIGDS